ncbi:DUF1028 domain-containing protein [Pseudooceanicola sediminis]|uniref:DUF1028 domain-containing protein n=1 Tax=Pseudooceanicola sediminis TaxID=2211117 RepID=A0A399J1Z5_9RHOB|nr:DUF1028 domain-containing protein [Pseudooceanicola sediminis]KAA2313838.1 DUF1028 domain-containing protein [Puniceibacterium sp. HSS470]RII38657.1 DUF1028 domain-containing protein [Pseudooceanicola sediminis]|tara:strand:+ start:15552 stop:16268 length:717 start_codon:yes stop_codon:yes gene_type:complete
MTFSILARDAETGRIGGAAATGSLCVGGWVLRGRVEAGLTASQGTAPSTLWGEAALDEMQAGSSAAQAVSRVTTPDPGRAHRQLAALDVLGGTAAFTGEASVPACASRSASGVIVSGNMLTSESVLDAVLSTFVSTTGALPDRLLAALTAGEKAGSDSRGLMSSAMLCLGPDMPPLNLRIDYSETPLGDLAGLLGRATARPYADWSYLVPTRQAPFRAPTDQDLARLNASVPTDMQGK